ncbi:MAG: helix-turn-helix domain-containing protein [Oscillospiraceae bacterium]|nr:helix-turn-helix domain-containing protein [Oscillospiraceae bacterium]MDE7172079.1 helix-turn-helix domain-containing protein [Oscillospiraceae bacterium]
MKLGEKLQQLRKQSGLSQEQLAAQLTVSRQAVSKWELDETVPDTENVVQLSRIFGVSCDYLLRDEVDEQGAALPTAGNGGASAAHASAAHLNEQGWIHNAFALSLGVCAIGLVTGLLFYRFGNHTVRPLVVGFMIQMLGVVLFELATPRMGDGRNTARFHFYGTVCWLLPPIPVILAFNWVSDLRGWMGTPMQALTCYFAAYLLTGAAVMVVLSLLRRRQTAKK